MCLKKLGVIPHVSMTTMEKPSHEDHYALKEKLFFSERETKPKTPESYIRTMVEWK